MASLHEQYRPRKWADVAGQPEAVAAIQRTLARGWGGRAWWITGVSGAGKTTLAKLIAAEGADELAIDEQSAGGLTTARLRDLERGYQSRTLFGKGGHCVIVNECHGLRRDTVRELLDVLERLPAHVTWIFTTTKQGQTSLFEDDESGDCAPLVSRCVEIELENTSQSRQALAKRAKAVGMAAGCDGLPESVYGAAIDACKGNMRALLQRVESGQLAKEAEREWRRYLSQPLDKQDKVERARVQGLIAELQRA